ncbi:glycoside hydrolase family 95 protein [Bipolaris oryzae ATCC 44560]|uniref:Glycoside hydrolase family 95 protein n=1 Tax=Bipolaris oryzae ATCC 44560 TaxID=930090 RepID=W6ZHX3_COCMI|nr:glycoside hydrolase family 95 protein [Bipolaris oryzae ATCC 44560]EUC49538.1 glycoside hydrolase family 95 protein [Bipolaris oryzae ATCC 44560]
MLPKSLLPSVISALIHGTSAKLIWSTSPANTSDVIRTALPVGNGRLAAMPIGPPSAEALTLNLDSLWSGGPFEVSNYTGGNPESSIDSALPGIRDWIFTNGTGNVTKLLGTNDNYGTYRVLANLTVAIPSLVGTQVSNYTRKLDLINGLHSTSFNTNDTQLETTVFCSYPDQVCVYTIQSSGNLPAFEIKLGNELVDPKLENITCATNGTGTGSDHVRLRGITQLGPPEGMIYDTIARLLPNSRLKTACNSNTGILKVTPGDGAKSATVIIGAETNYDMKKGTAEYQYSFRGNDPGPVVEETIRKASTKTLEELKNIHLEDFTSLTGRFEFLLPDPLNSAQVPTPELMASYDSNVTSGDPFIESLLFDYAQYLLISSSRPGSLPTNLQGRWTEQMAPDWSADYHANINLQMNYWTADQTGLTETQTPLWDYMINTWVPRGHETALLLYGAPGWVVHNEMNIFGHTGMKDGEGWANYPAAPAWMMLHIFDYWDYTRDTAWLRTQGYPLIKSVAQFWLSQLHADAFTNDNTLIVNPCSSPEHGPTTFGCAHHQQLIHQVFDAVLTTHSLAGETDTSFTSNVSSTLSRLDKGFHVGSWSQIKEWKLPDSFGYEFQNDTHRHISELVGWHPGYSLSSFLGGYSNTTVQSAVRNKLISRGIGNGPDANSGWEKVWRGACWARLNDTAQAHLELRYAIEQNFVGNGFSMYKGERTPFQIDANYGYGGLVLSMLVVDLPAPAEGQEGKRKVVLGPAIPESWKGGKVKGLRIRGGGVVDFGWDDEGIVREVTVVESVGDVEFVNKEGDMLTGS